MNDVIAMAIVSLLLIFGCCAVTRDGICQEAREKHYVLEHCK